VGVLKSFLNPRKINGISKCIPAVFIFLAFCLSFSVPHDKRRTEPSESIRASSFLEKMANPVL
jgi:hypothetical protein